MKNEKFVYEISVDAVPHNEKTCTEIFGGGYNPDFPINTHASELIGTVLQDAVIACIRAETRHLAECKCEIKDMTEAQKRFHDFLCKKTSIAEAVEKSLKFVRMEKL